jgi:radical SAM superfamily enzyme YgiQ (UPF0313 family)
MHHAGQVWLVDATTYRRPVYLELRTLKERFLRIEHCARTRRFGPHTSRGVLTYSPGLLRIATLLAASGMAVRYMTFDDAARLIESGQDPPDFVGFGAVCPTVPRCAALARTVRRRWPRTRVALGGPHAAIAPRLTGLRFPWFHDVIDSFDQVAAARLVGRSVDSIAEPVMYLNYNLLPAPVAEYGLNLSTFTGCPFTCLYCQDNLVPKRRMEMDGGLASLLGHLKRRTPVHFCDSVFGGTITRARQICRVLSGLDHGMLLSCDIRPEFARPELLRDLQEAGFAEVRIGLDSADENVLAGARRSAQAAGLSAVLERIRDWSDLYVSVYLVTGLPGSVQGTLDLNLEKVDKLLGSGLADQIKHHLYVPYPSDQRPGGGPGVQLRTTDWARYDRSSFPVFELDGLSAEAIWNSFLDTERAILQTWSSFLGLEPAQINRWSMYPDYNRAMYLDSVAPSRRIG